MRLLISGASDVYFCQYDVTSRDGAREVFEKVTERFSHSLSVLVNNNAVLSPENGASANIEDDQKFADIIGLNVMAAVRFTQVSKIFSGSSNNYTQSDTVTWILPCETDWPIFYYF